MTTHINNHRATRKRSALAFERSYRTALGAHVRSARGSATGDRIGRRAQQLGVATLALARIHERAASALAQPGGNGNGTGPRRRTPARAARTKSFFAQAVAPIEAANCGVLAARREARRLAALLVRRTGELAAARALVVAQRSKLNENTRHQREQLESARLMELRMKRISHRLLSAQEEERLRISRDLHDAIGQTLTGINVGLASLKNEAATDSRDLAQAISEAQQLVERSMKTVHQFAWELRPTLLDDLGLVPALRSFSKLFSERTGIKVRFTANARFDRLDDDRNTALFRVAQGALSNVERHARADHAYVTLHSIPGAVRLEVRDDGRSFAVRKMETSKTNRHLGLLVMRERVEMVGGRFSIESMPGHGTAVRADVPLEGASRD